MQAYGVNTYKISTIVDWPSVRFSWFDGVNTYKISTIVDSQSAHADDDAGVNTYKISTIVDGVRSVNLTPCV